MNPLQVAVVVFLFFAGCGREPPTQAVPRNSTEGKISSSQPKLGAPSVQVGQPGETDKTSVAPLKGGLTSIRPIYSKAGMTVGTRSFSPVRVLDRWPSEHLVGESLVRIHNTSVESLNNATGERHWSVQSEEGVNLRWLGQHQGILYQAADTSMNGAKNKQSSPAAAVRRLRLRDGVWLKPMSIPADAAERNGVNRVSAFLDDRDGILVLNNTESDKGFNATQLGYRVTRFAGETAEVMWSKYFESAGTLPAPGAFLLGSLGPARDNAAIVGLSRLGSRIVVCGGPLENLLAMELNEGAVVWQVPRLWEYRRGFIGPSVWRHFLNRYGMEQRDLDWAELTLDELRAQEGEFFANETGFQAFKQHVKQRRDQVAQQFGAITAGPVVLAAPKRDEDPTAEPQFSIFVATAQSARSDWPAYLSDCLVYELDQDGTPVGILTLPRFVEGTAFSIIDDSLAWRCAGDAIARLFPSFDRDNRDLIIDLEWRVNRTQDDRKPWFRHGGWPDSVAFVADSIIRVQHGGFVETPESRDYCFRFEVGHLLSGAKRQLALNVPFEGKIVPPTINYSHIADPEGKEWWVTYASFPLQLVMLEVRGDRFVVVLEHEKIQNSLEFDLGSVLDGISSGQLR